MSNSTSILWEEKNLIEQSTKSENKSTSVLNDGINEIKNVSAKNECEDIGSRKKWIRKCPKCNKEMNYYSKHGYEGAKKINRDCRSCINTISLRTKNNYVGMKFGKITITNQYYLDRGNLRVDFTCDCGNKETNKVFRTVKTRTMCFNCSRILPTGVGAFNMLWYSYTRSAKRRNLEFKLTKEKFKEIIQQNCFYCGGIPSNIMKSTGGEYIYNGIDRRDNNIGYTLENCVPACKNCNFFKFQSSQSDFLNHVKKIYEYQFVENRHQ